jgi:uncharacterized protein (TIGR02284 family)
VAEKWPRKCRNAWRQFPTGGRSFLEIAVTQDREHAAQVLYSLIETGLDSVDGYEKAAELARNPRFQALFRERAQARQRLVQELKDEAGVLGGQSPAAGSVLGQAHRVFAELRNRIAGQSDKAMIEEVERGENFICDRFQEAARNEALPAEVRALVQRASDAISADRDAARALEAEFQ